MGSAQRCDIKRGKLDKNHIKTFYIRKREHGYTLMKRNIEVQFSIIKSLLNSY